ncbi:MAG: hypothetical protein ACLR5H_05450 [Oscillospiraceae bacterium]
MICELTGMDVSNASVYDGATAAAEAAAMCRERKRRVTLISGAAHPDTINTVRTCLLRHRRRAAGGAGEGRQNRYGRPAGDAGRRRCFLLRPAAQLLRPV